MSILRPLDLATNPTHRPITLPSLWTFFCPALYTPSYSPIQPPRRNLQTRRITAAHHPSPRHDFQPKKVENACTTALVRASTCHKYIRQSSSFPRPTTPCRLPSSHHKPRRKTVEGVTSPTSRNFRSVPTAVRSPSPAPAEERSSSEVLDWGLRRERQSLSDLQHPHTAEQGGSQSRAQQSPFSQAHANSVNPASPQTRGILRSEAKEIASWSPIAEENLPPDPNEYTEEDTVSEDFATWSSPWDLSTVSAELKRSWKELVNIYSEWDSSITLLDPPKPTSVDQSSKTIVNGELIYKPSSGDRLPTSDELQHLEKLLVSTPWTIDHNVLYEAYERLPYPRTPRLPSRTLRKFLHTLTWIQRPTQAASMRYLSVLDDMKASGLEITVQEWTSAVHLAGYAAGKLTRTSVESSLQMWRQMEISAGVKGNIVTFTILFDRAVKAGKLVLADMIYREMVNRKLKIDAYTRLARIYYHGKRGDGEAVRFGYAKFVDAGEVVSTAVLTCVIESLFNAGEPAAAEAVFAKMKEFHAQKSGATTPPLDWRDDRRLRRILVDSADKWREQPEAREAIQDAAPIAPNRRTYRSLIKYYVRQTGNYDRVAELLHEMRERNVPPDWAIYLWVFWGFKLHGGVPFTLWTLPLLERIWSSMLIDAEERPNDFEYIADTDFVVGAFVQCASHARAMEIWDEYKKWWQPTLRAEGWIEKMLAHRQPRIEAPQ